MSSGRAVSTTVSTGGQLVVLPGGIATDTMLSGGVLVSAGVVVYQPGSGVTTYPSFASGVTVSSGGME